MRIFADAVGRGCGWSRMRMVADADGRGCVRSQMQIYPNIRMRDPQISEESISSIPFNFVFKFCRYYIFNTIKIFSIIFNYYYKKIIIYQCEIFNIIF